MSVLLYGSRILKIRPLKMRPTFKNLSQPPMYLKLSSLHPEQRFFSDGTDPCVVVPTCKHDGLSPPKGMSDSIFRKFFDSNEQLGPGADKCGNYKNPEYYGYQKYSFASALVEILEIRIKQEAKRQQEAERIVMTVICVPEEEKKENICDPEPKAEPAKANAEAKECIETTDKSKPKEAKKKKKKKKKKCDNDKK